MSQLIKLCNDYSAYNHWANSRLSDWLLTLDQSYLTKEVKSSYKSIDLTVQHMLRAQKFWHLFILERDYSHFDWQVKTNMSYDILEELKNNSALILEDFSRFNEDDLAKALFLDMSWSRNRQARLDYIIHMINHSSYHRGQVVSIARSIDITDNIPNTDYNIYKSSVIHGTI